MSVGETLATTFWLHGAAIHGPEEMPDYGKGRSGIWNFLLYSAGDIEVSLLNSLRKYAESS